RVPGDGGAVAEDRECPGAIAGAGRVADGSCGAADDHSGREADHGADLGAGSGGRRAFFFDQESDQLLRAVWGREEFGEHRAAHTPIETTQQTFTDDAD